MSQVLAKVYDCKTCNKPIRIAKIDNVPPGQKKKWEKYELDGITLHLCRKKQQPEQLAATEEKQLVVSNDLFKEVPAIKAELLELVSRLDRIEQEMIEH